MIRRILFIAFAIVLSAAAALMVHAFLNKHAGPGRANGSTPSGATPVVRVLVASVDLPVGALLRDTDLHWQSWPAESAVSYIVEGHVRVGDFAGAVLRSRLAAGEPVLAAELAKPGERGFMAAVLTPGDSAVTVTVAANTGMAGFVFPGDHVDLLLATTVPPATPTSLPRHMSRTLLTDLRVVGVDQTLSDEHRTDKKDLVVPKTVTLEVTPKQAEIVAVAADLGTLTLSLRSLSSPAGVPPVAAGPTWDTEVTHVAPSVMLMPTPPSKVVLARAPVPVRVYRGGQSLDAAAAPPPRETAPS